MTGQGFPHPRQKGKLFKLNVCRRVQAKQAPRVSSATLESGNRVITGIINNARLLNCLFKVYVFMVCRTWWQGVGEEWVYLICIHFGIVQIFYDALCKRFGDVAVRAPFHSSLPTENMIHLIIIFKSSRTETDRRRRWSQHSEKD